MRGTAFLNDNIMTVKIYFRGAHGIEDWRFKGPEKPYATLGGNYVTQIGDADMAIQISPVTKTNRLGLNSDISYYTDRANSKVLSMQVEKDYLDREEDFQLLKDELKEAGYTIKEPEEPNK
jgi:hypothetical protein